MVYLVEDDENVRNLAVYALRQAGIASRGFSDDAEFRTACAERVPDVVLLDIMLPGVDGIDILKRIRKTPGMSRVPVMMATAKNTELDIVSALDAGADVADFSTHDYDALFNRDEAHPSPLGSAYYSRCIYRWFTEGVVDCGE